MGCDWSEQWLCAIAEMLASPWPTFSVPRVSQELASTFRESVVYWNTVRETLDVEMDVEAAAPPPDVVAEWVQAGGLQRHPLVRWYRTSSSAPQTVDRVPNAVASRRFFDEWMEVARPWGIEHQLSVPLRVSDHSYETLVVVRGGEPFTDAEFEFGCALQPALAALYTQAHRFAAVTHGMGGMAADCRDHTLTRRETAVVGLLAEGLTAVAIAHRLGISSRTVHKHLEHAYAKLGVRDKVTAVTRARALGLLGRVACT